MTFYRDSSNRSVSAEDIAKRWIAEHPEEAAKLIQAARGRPLDPRPFVIQGKATKDGKVHVERTDVDPAA